MAVPSDEEAERLFGAPLARRGIQPVWVRIENHGAEAWFTRIKLPRAGHAALPGSGASRLGEGVGETPRSAPHYMDDGAPFFADGLRAVMQFTDKQIGHDEVQFFEWERLPPR